MLLRRGKVGMAALSLTALGLVAVPAGAAYAQGEAGQDASGGISNKPVTINVEGADLYYVLKLLFQQIHANFTLDNSLRGTPVTVQLTNQPFRIALEAVLRASSL